MARTVNTVGVGPLRGAVARDCTPLRGRACVTSVRDRARLLAGPSAGPTRLLRCAWSTTARDIDHRLTRPCSAQSWRARGWRSERMKAPQTRTWSQGARSKTRRMTSRLALAPSAQPGSGHLVRGDVHVGREGARG
jgi:hypothetical protein